MLVSPFFHLVLQDKVRQRVPLSPLGVPGMPHLAKGSHGKPWRPPDPGHVPPTLEAPSPPSPAQGTDHLSCWKQLGFGWLLQGKAKPFSFPFFFSCCILMGLEISRRKMLFPFYQLGAHTRLPGSLPPLLCFPPSSPWLQTKMCEFFDLPGSPHWGIGSGVNYTQPGSGCGTEPFGWRGSCPFSPPATNFKGTGGQGRYH